MSKDFLFARTLEPEIPIISPSATVHELKSWPLYFDQILAGTKTAELRRNDRNYQIGDRLELREYDPQSDIYTGRSLKATITSITSSNVPCAISATALDKDFCILSIRLDYSPN